MSTDYTPTAGAEEAAKPGEVWQEADGCLLTCLVPGDSWAAFGRGPRLAWDAPSIARPLRRLLDTRGDVVLLDAERERIAQAIEAANNCSCRDSYCAQRSTAKRDARIARDGGLS